MIRNSDIRYHYQFIVTPISKLITCRCPILLQSPPGPSSLERISGGRAIFDFWKEITDVDDFWVWLKNASPMPVWPLLVSNHSFLFWRLWASPAAVGWFVMPFQLPSTAQLLSHFSRASQARKMTAKRLTSACAPVGLWPTARHCGSCFSFFNGCRPVDWTRYCFCTLWAELILWFSQNTTNSHWQNRSDPENTYITYSILG